MSDQEKFLSRWSRRKLEPADEKVPSEPPQAADAPAASADAAKPAAASPARQGEAAPVPEFDLSKLPSLDSIGADSDIKAFLQSGVPLALRNAALRRAWSADPAIRNYIGPAEYAWDFTDPKAMPGFGDLGPDVDIKKLVAEVFGDAKSDIEPLADAASSAPTPAQSASPADANLVTATSTASESAAAGPQHGTPIDDEPLLQRDENVATQHNDPQKHAAATSARRHGGAIPR